MTETSVVGEEFERAVENDRSRFWCWAVIIGFALYFILALVPWIYIGAPVVGP